MSACESTAFFSEKETQTCSLDLLLSCHKGAVH